VTESFGRSFPIDGTVVQNLELLGGALDLRRLVSYLFICCPTWEVRQGRITAALEVHMEGASGPATVTTAV